MIANLLSVSMFRPALGILYEWNNEICDLLHFLRYVLRFFAFIIYQYISAFLSGIILLSRYYILYIHPCTARYELFPPFSYFAHVLCCCEHFCTSTSLNLASKSFSYKSRSGIPGPYGNSMFSLGNYTDVFPNSRALPAAMIDKGFDFSTFSMH